MEKEELEAGLNCEVVNDTEPELFQDLDHVAGDGGHGREPTSAFFHFTLLLEIVVNEEVAGGNVWSDRKAGTGRSEALHRKGIGSREDLDIARVGIRPNA